MIPKRWILGSVKETKVMVGVHSLSSKTSRWQNSLFEREDWFPLDEKNVAFILVKYCKSNCSRELSLKNVSKTTLNGLQKANPIWSFKKKDIRVLFFSMKERDWILAVDPLCQFVSTEMWAQSRWSKKVMTLKACGIPDISPERVNTCNYLSKQVLSFQKYY